MANIPYPVIIPFLFLSVSAFRVPSASENPDLIIDENLNLVEPKMDLWDVLLRPKTKTTFKNILKLLNSFDMRDKYSADDHQAQPISHQPTPNSNGFKVVKKDKVSFEKSQEHIVLFKSLNAGLVSEEVPERESLSEDHRSTIDIGSISMETEEKSENSNESSKNAKATSSQNSESSKEASSDESSVKPSRPKSENNPKTEKLRQLETLRYEPDIPKSLHHFETDKPRYQHSIRDGWIY